jgi:translocation and assembly module TamB
VISFVKTDIDLRQLTLERPVIHVIVKPDGSTNVPEPKVKSTGDPMQQLFDLAIGRTELRNGLLILNDQKLPLDFKADDVGLMMDYQRLRRRYDSALHAGKIDAQFQDWRDIPASLDAEFSLERHRVEVRSFKLTSQKSSVELSGTVDDFNHPKLHLSYDGTIDLAQLGGTVRVSQLRSGGATFSGSGTFSQEDFSTSGKVGLRGVIYEYPSLSLRDVSAGSEFALDREHILLKKIDAN